VGFNAYEVDVNVCAYHQTTGLHAYPGSGLALCVVALFTYHKVAGAVMAWHQGIK
jgi:hypothetical protein